MAKAVLQNHDPKVISRFYLESVEKARGTYHHITPNLCTAISYVLCIGCPRVVRADHGTENCLVAKVHIGFRMHHSDDLGGAEFCLWTFNC